jgi:predicted transcriptional regulator
LLIYEGMGYSAFDDYSRQQIAINANQQEGVDPVRLGTSTAIGGAGAAVLGEAGKQVGKVAKKVFNKQNETNENSNILDVSQEKGINVKSDLKSNLSYSDLIIDGKKTIETRNTNSLKPYVGKRVSIVKTGEGKENTKAIGSVIIGEPEIVGVKKFRQLKNEHLVPEGSEFDIKKEKYLYPLKQPIRFEKPFSVSKYGIVERKIIKND